MSQQNLNKSKILKELQVIPSIGKACALDLWNLGIRKVSDLKGKNPKTLYNRSNKLVGIKQDPCLLYTFRCAVYFASEKRLTKEKLNWWYWKDKTYNE
ncbi:MAG: hypothetical protein NTZ27_11290 [Ignavibacteriales bacterium]|nr:hypothetical protein [Ignavibacteriales bacterium]